VHADVGRGVEGAAAASIFFSSPVQEPNLQPAISPQAAV
jgi:hypothetical protein